MTDNALPIALVANQVPPRTMLSIYPEPYASHMRRYAVLSTGVAAGVQAAQPRGDRPLQFQLEKLKL